MRRSAEERFWMKVSPEPNTGCWLWIGCMSDHGYGRFYAGRMIGAHKWYYEYLHGPVPGGLELDHLCRVRCCVNPEHLEPVTHLENSRRGVAGYATAKEHRGKQNRAKTHCPMGHPYSGRNLILTRRGRKCRQCKNEHHKLSRAAKRAVERRARASGAGSR